jgi:hypothetical protein
MADVAQAQYHARRFCAALFDGQALRLERSGLSEWRLVFQPIRMAIAVHVRGLVCAWWIGTGNAVHTIAHSAGTWQRLSPVRFDNDNGGPLRRAAVADPTGNLRRLQSERQNQPRALSLATLCCVRFLCRSSAATRWPGLEWRIFRPAIKCGQQSLEVFCTGIFLSFAAHFVLVEISGAIWMQILVSIVGILMMTALAYYRSWSKNVDKAPKIKPVVAAG